MTPGAKRGGCGTFLWVKTTVYEYVCARYGVHPDPGSTIMTDTPISKIEGAPIIEKTAEQSK